MYTPRNMNTLVIISVPRCSLVVHVQIDEEASTAAPT